MQGRGTRGRQRADEGQARGEPPLPRGGPFEGEAEGEAEGAEGEAEEERGEGRGGRAAHLDEAEAVDVVASRAEHELGARGQVRVLEVGLTEPPLQGVRLPLLGGIDADDVLAIVQRVERPAARVAVDALEGAQQRAPRRGHASVLRSRAQRIGDHTREGDVHPWAVARPAARERRDRGGDGAVNDAVGERRGKLALALVQAQGRGHV
jgi:hypothetical protein